MRSYRRETVSNVINFSCIDYDSLVGYCKTFGLHRFEYQYHYDLAQSAHSDGRSTHCTLPTPSTQSMAARREERHSKRVQGDGARIGRDGKRENDRGDGDGDGDGNGDGDGEREKVKKKRGRKSKKRKEGGTEHHYFNSDLLDRHYERRRRERIPKTFEPATRLTKSELVAVVKEHFLSTPLLAELNEMDVFQQFLRFIVERRNKLKKELVDVRKQ